MKSAVKHLKPGDVVQIDPKSQWDWGFFSGCFMLVTEVSQWGAMGFISIPKGRGEIPGQAYYRCKWKDMEFVGEAEWISTDMENEVSEGRKKRNQIIKMVGIQKDKSDAGGGE